MQTAPLWVPITLGCLLVVVIFALILSRFNDSRDLPAHPVSGSRRDRSLAQLCPAPLLENRTILVVTLETRDLELARIHDQNIEEYCRRRGYTYRRLRSWDSALPVFWQKIEVVRAALAEQNDAEKRLWDYVLWLDSDTYIVEDRPLESLFASDKDIFIGEDRPLGIPWNTWCAGVFAVKNTSEGRQFLDDVLTRLLNNPHCRDEQGRPALKGGWSGECYEQGVMNGLLHTAYKDSFTGWKPELVYNINLCDTHTFILHMFGRFKGATLRCFQMLARSQTKQ